MDIDLGLKKSARETIEKGLGDIFADTYSLYLKTQNFHWNLKGSDFYSLHILFEKQYEELADAVDEIAERIQAIGFFVDGSFTGIQERSSIKESRKPLKDKHMIKELLEGHETICRSMRPLIHEFQKLLDEASADLLIKRLGVHEKAAWMLRSHLE